MMNTRSYSTTMRSVEQERFAVPRVSTRSTEPEVFTFECVLAQATAVKSCVPIRPKKRCTRVMYPAKVRMHLPPPERSQAKRWLLVLVLVVLWQIYTEDPCDGPVGDYHGFQEKALELVPSVQSGSEETGGFTDDAVPCGPAARALEPFEQSAGKSCVVALLVYHRLGTDK
uniref:Radiation-inducible immediate-early gene IEX-1 n=1 Tax=Gouania willdenowi TaxID=441366 RepID=A0A8C5EPT0_GOUWI